MGPGEDGAWQHEGSFVSSTTSLVLDSSVRMLRGSNKALVAPLPNLFRTTFEQANQQSPGEQWLKQRMAAFDLGNKQKRKEVLEEFLEYMHQSKVASMEELFSHQAHLFFIRLTSWFAVTLPMFYELSLQVKVFLAFLEFREQIFIRAFFESGAVVTLMHTLSVNFDCSDEVRCLVLVALHKLAANGRYHKELLCGEGLISKVMDCMSDGMQWETLKCAGRLLCEIFCANQRYQHEVLESLQTLMTHRLPLTQRVGMQAIISLLAGERQEIPKILQDSMRYTKLVRLALPMLDSSDLRVGADAYCLICRLLLAFGCDELCFDFCQSQIMDGADLNLWVRLEMDSLNPPGFNQDDYKLHETGNLETPFGGWWKMSTDRVYGHISEMVLAQHKITDDSADTVKLVNRSNTIFCDAFRKESAQILKWALLLFILKRCPQLCYKLVDEGLAETLLMCLLDVARPVQQAAALSELHRLQLMSPLAQQIVASVLVKSDLIHATSLVEFMKLAKTADLDRARYRLRNIWNCLHCSPHCHDTKHSADEMCLRQKMLEKDMADSLGIVSGSANSFFLTGIGAENNGKEGSENNGKSANDDVVHRSGKDTFDVRRAPVLNTTGGIMGEEHSRIEMGSVDEIPFCGSLSSLVFDPLDISADEESPLIQELRAIEGLGTLRIGSSDILAPSISRTSRKSRKSGIPLPRALRKSLRKGDHRATLLHTRALALRPMPPRGVLHGRRKQLVQLDAFDRSPSSMSQLTEISLRCGDIHDLGDPGRLAPCHSCHEGHDEKALHGHSLAETSVGPEWLAQETSFEFPSSGPSLELHGSGPSMELLTGGPSLMSESSDPLHERSQDELFGGISMEMPSIEEASAEYLSLRTPTIALLEVQRMMGYDDRMPTIQKRILQVATTPSHICLAFDPLENERERQNLSKQVTHHLHPKTRRLFDDISDAGKFPKKNVVRQKMPPLKLPRDYSHPSGSQSARNPPVNRADVVFTPTGLAPLSNVPAAATAPGSVWQLLSDPLLQDAGDRMRALFPASARAAQ